MTYPITVHNCRFRILLQSNRYKMKILSKILAKMELKKIILVHLVLVLVALEFLSGNVRDVVKELRQFQHKKTATTVL